MTNPRSGAHPKRTNPRSDKKRFKVASGNRSDFFSDSSANRAASCSALSKELGMLLVKIMESLIEWNWYPIVPVKTLDLS